MLPFYGPGEHGWTIVSHTGCPVCVKSRPVAKLRSAHRVDRMNLNPCATIPLQLVSAAFTGDKVPDVRLSSPVNDANLLLWVESASLCKRWLRAALHQRPVLPLLVRRYIPVISGDPGVSQ